MDYAEFYYINTVGYYPHDTDKEKLITKATVDYLLECGVSEPEVIKVIETSKSSDCLTPEALPDWLWNDSLIERRTYYYHHALHITSPVPKFNPRTNVETTTKFYIEMRIRFTLDQLVDYFYNTLMINKDLVDRKRDTGSFNYLLNKYSKLGFVRSLDFVLSLIDAVNADKNQVAPVTNILDIARYESEVHENLKRMTDQAELYKTNRIIWRSEEWKDL